MASLERKYIYVLSQKIKIEWRERNRVLILGCELFECLLNKAKTWQYSLMRCISRLHHQCRTWLDSDAQPCPISLTISSYNLTTHSSTKTFWSLKLSPRDYSRLITVVSIDDTKNPRMSQWKSDRHIRHIARDKVGIFKPIVLTCIMRHRGRQCLRQNIYLLWFKHILDKKRVIILVFSQRHVSGHIAMLYHLEKWASI